ncbi:MAG: hypothetical protein RLZZ381_659 [Cyanobacteriota bacterium]|jgi:hypothetical protein
MAHSQKSIRDHARNRTHPNVDNQVWDAPGCASTKSESESSIKLI